MSIEKFDKLDLTLLRPIIVYERQERWLSMDGIAPWVLTAARGIAPEREVFAIRDILAAYGMSVTVMELANPGMLQELPLVVARNHA